METSGQNDMHVFPRWHKWYLKGNTQNRCVYIIHIYIERERERERYTYT